jgi:hypothetical protein
MLALCVATNETPLQAGSFSTWRDPKLGSRLGGANWQAGHGKGGALGAGETTQDCKVRLLGGTFSFLDTPPGSPRPAAMPTGTGGSNGGSTGGSSDAGAAGAAAASLGAAVGAMAIRAGPGAGITLASASMPAMPAYAGTGVAAPQQQQQQQRQRPAPAAAARSLAASAMAHDPAAAARIAHAAAATSKFLGAFKSPAPHAYSAGAGMAVDSSIRGVVSEKRVAQVCIASSYQ